MTAGLVVAGLVALLSMVRPGPIGAATDGRTQIDFDYHAVLAGRAYASQAWVWSGTVEDGPFSGQGFSLTLLCRGAVNGPRTELYGDIFWYSPHSSVVANLRAGLDQPGPAAAGYLELLAPTDAGISGELATPKDAWTIAGTVTLPENLLCTNSWPGSAVTGGAAGVEDVPPAPALDGHVTLMLSNHHHLRPGQYRNPRGR